MIHDHSMASLGVLPDPGLSDPLVMTASPCNACTERADPKEWKWGRCHAPSAPDAALLADAPMLLAEVVALRSRVESLEKSLPTIDHARRIIQRWLDYNARGRGDDGMNDDCHVMNADFENGPPTWPTRGCLKQWAKELGELAMAISPAANGDAARTSTESVQ